MGETLGIGFILVVIFIIVYAIWLFFFPMVVIGRLNSIIKLLEKITGESSATNKETNILKWSTKKPVKRDEILEVVVENGRWICPSCKEPNISMHDVCDNCGQEVSKNE